MPHRRVWRVDKVYSNALVNGFGNFSAAAKLLILRELSWRKVVESVSERRGARPIATLPHLAAPQPTGLAALWPWARCATAGLIRPEHKSFAPVSGQAGAGCHAVSAAALVVGG